MHTPPDSAARRPAVSASDRECLLLLVLTAMALLVSGIEPHDRGTWVLETAPVFIAIAVLGGSRRRFPFTALAYRLIFAHALVLIVGAHYTYAEVPAGDWIRETFGLARNHYDRLGHFMQGFVPAIVARELLLRTAPLRPGKWLFTLVSAACLAISACYEFLEWWAALLLGGGADAFLATQGDVWDTQWDMFLALCGALTAQITLARAHDRELGPAL
ncbi:MAG: DUF2238 domain-containing protein [Gammaproteobacteria bacterium]|nr:DUF2238 domain-containing protein [Gammaproteobacteria bacterium]